MNTLNKSMFGVFYRTCKHNTYILDSCFASHTEANTKAQHLVNELSKTNTWPEFSTVVEMVTVTSVNIYK